MSHAARRIVPIVLLLALAGACGYLAYGAFAGRPATTYGWTRAASTARRAERTRAELPALRTRQHAIELFDVLADSGPRTVRSRAAMLAGLLLLGNARADAAHRQDLLDQSAGSLRRAVRLDRSNDDAAFDLELLLSQAKASGQPIAQTPNRTTKRHGRPSSGEVGRGY